MGTFLIIILGYATNIFGQTIVVGLKNDSLPNQKPTHIVIDCRPFTVNKENSPLFEIRLKNLVFVIDSEDSLTITKIEPRWIESVKVIKGQDAIEQYGSRAKNGVILVELISDSLSILPLEIKQKLKSSN